VLRPLRFGERSGIVGSAACDRSPLDAAAAGVLVTSVVSNSGALDSTVLEIAAMVLAGAQEDAPAFDEALGIAQRRTGLAAVEVEQLPARDVDRLALPAGGLEQASGWHRIVFAPERELTLDEIRNELAGKLLARSGAVAGSGRFSRSVLDTPRSAARFDTRTSPPDGPGAPHSAQKFEHTVIRAAAASPQEAAISSPQFSFGRFVYAATSNRKTDPPVAVRYKNLTEPPVFPLKSAAIADATMSADHAPDWPGGAVPPAEIARFQKADSASRLSGRIGSLGAGGSEPHWVARVGESPVETVLRNARPASATGTVEHSGAEWVPLPEIAGRRFTNASPQAASSPNELADAIATLLNEEADLRGID
jgi:hypothetical protein